MGKEETQLRCVCISYMLISEMLKCEKIFLRIKEIQCSPLVQELDRGIPIPIEHLGKVKLYICSRELWAM